jgi:hypothetical protein
VALFVIEFSQSMQDGIKDTRGPELSRLTQRDLMAIRKTAFCLEGMFEDVQTALRAGAVVDSGPYAIDQQALAAIIAAGVPHCVLLPEQVSATPRLPSLPNGFVMGRLLGDNVPQLTIPPDVARALRKHNRRLYLQMLAALEVFVKVAIKKSEVAEERDWLGLIRVHVKAKYHLSKLRWAALAHLLYLRPRALGITSSVTSLLALLRLRAPALIIPIRPL